MQKAILDRIKQKVHELPLLPGVYKMLDMYGNIIYIGKAKKLRNRVSSYFLNTEKHPKVQKMVDNVYDFEYIITPSELEALNLESNLIHKHQPFYNILLKDGKAFPYIKIDYNSPYPRVVVTRRVLNDKAMYFGPYLNKINVTDLYKIINNSFKLRDCNLNVDKKNNRECLNYQIGLCMAPCTHRCTASEYRAEVDRVIDFLHGDLSYARQVLIDKMHAYSDMQMYEKAIEIRDDLRAIENIDAQNITGLSKNTDIDVFGYADNGDSAVITVLCVRGNKMVGVNNYNVIDASIDVSDIISNFITQYYMSNKVVPKHIVVGVNVDSLGEWLHNYAGHHVEVYHGKRDIYHRLLDMANTNASEYLNKSIARDKVYELKTMGAMHTLQKVLSLTRLPHRIEGYDISNLSGTNTVASMVVFTDGISNKKMYRKFKIAESGQNDFQNMHNVLTRRLEELHKGTDISFRERPDLILIDGGIIQLTFAVNSLKEMGEDIDIISLAKKQEEIYKVDGSKVVLSRDNYALKLLQNVRDESHRFAITFNKSLRRKNTLVSELQNIPLIGKKKVNILFEHFKSIDNIRNATINELCSVDGVGEKLAQVIFEYFHK